MFFAKIFFVSYYIIDFAYKLMTVLLSLIKLILLSNSTILYTKVNSVYKFNFDI